MIPQLHAIEQILPEWLSSNLEQWNSLNVDYAVPVVQRLWRQFGSHRVYLHKILPHEGYSHYHPHPWPCAVKLLGGSYEMKVGFGDPHGEPPAPAAVVVLSEGSYYKMMNPNGWHAIRPLGKPSYSLMITGLPWPDSRKEQVNFQLKPLSQDVIGVLIQEFKLIVNMDKYL